MHTDQKQKAMIAMSGGVDSSVAALLAMEDGLDATGVTCKMFGSNVLGGGEAFDAFMDEVDDAKQVCRRLGIEHYVFNYKDAFERCVIESFVVSYLAGRTPNPCVDCNRHVKFGALQRRREELGFDVLVTGHYARVRFDEESGRWQLMRARHVEKDQSYMLCQLPQDVLARSLFPLGELSKEEVRAKAEAAGFANARKGESQDICFVPDGDYPAFIERWTAKAGMSAESVDGKRNADSAKGAGCAGGAKEDLAPVIEDVRGNVLGRHEGLFRYTIGQRKGIGIAAGEPLYVVAKDATRNALVVGSQGDLLTREARADDVVFVSMAPDATDGPVRVLAKTSYRQSPRPATATFRGYEVALAFDEAVPRPAPGQALALYDAEFGDVVLAGATIA